MVKASALYIVIVIALVIGVVCASLIATSFYYKIQYQKKARYDQLDNNLGSGVNILLASADTAFSASKTFSLFNNESDSVYLKKILWGCYYIGIAEAFSQKDTLYKTFTIANRIDSSKWAALYMVDQDRPFSVSGKTAIIGGAYIPRGGVQTAFVNNQAYQGDKRMIVGAKHTSAKQLPALAQPWLSAIENFIKGSANADGELKSDSINQPFLGPPLLVNFKKNAKTLENIYLKNQVVLFSDTTVTIDSTASIQNILIFAKAVVIRPGFHGSCQVFATDSINVGKNCIFNYPSFLAVMRFDTAKFHSEEKIFIGQNTSFFGSILTYEKGINVLKPLIQVDKNVSITGQLYSQGIVYLADNLKINGSVFTYIFYYKIFGTLYEDYIVNTIINSKKLSPYYLTSGSLPVAGSKQKVLQWLESN